VINGKYQYSNIDPPFARNEAYAAIASIGALVEGWTLIVPKEHQFSMRYFYDDLRFTNFVQLVIPRLVSKYGAIIAFEHGANMEESLTSCGTDHAHLHLVPFEGSLVPDFMRSDMKWIRSRPTEIITKAGKNEYLFYTELGLKINWKDPSGFLHILKNPTSQYFRRLIAARIGNVETADYKLYPFMETAKRTRRELVKV
jgi:diadenosine tetraphosphate (Ap4A) HIT family hydrolase